MTWDGVIVALQIASVAFGIMNAHELAEHGPGGFRAVMACLGLVNWILLAGHLSELMLAARP